MNSIETVWKYTFRVRWPFILLVAGFMFVLFCLDGCASSDPVERARARAVNQSFIGKPSDEMLKFKWPDTSKPKPRPIEIQKAKGGER